MEKNTKIIIGVGAFVIVAAGVFLYFRGKKTAVVNTPQPSPVGAPPHDTAPVPPASHITDLHQLPSFGIVSKVPMMTEPTLAHGSEGLTAG